VVSVLAPRLSPAAIADRAVAAPRLSPAAIADRAVAALIAEAALTPKPGLVDRRGGGAHPDRSLDLLVRSAEALRPSFRACAAAAVSLPPGPLLRARLGGIGRDGEAAMLAATGGVNTHRGALWALGLLCAGAAADAGAREPGAAADAGVREPGAAADHGAPEPGAAADHRAAGPGAVVAFAAALAATPDAGPVPGGASHGARAMRRHGVPGATGEARAGFPHVGQALLVLRAARQRGVGEDDARLDALLAIMATLPDTCVLHRGGAAGLRAIQTAAASVLAAGGCSTATGRRRLSEVDTLARRRRLSPGGSADLLAAALFLDGGPGRADLAAPVSR
jgi:triphosphoribosyl-dephospho-CoA synthase